MSRSFFSKFTRAIRPDDIEDALEESFEPEENRWIKNHHTTDGELTVDVYETANQIVIKTIIAGVRKEDLEINVSRDMVIIKGKRESEIIDDNNYFHRELFWGTFSRTILLPQEIDIDRAEATENQGMLTLKLPKIDKARQSRIRVKSI
ncbi:MAG TPA: Hsp20/alpha crystallin family protein [Candidatus Paceibacterota bacterium]|nr:Hsp20/alpha crystallin family protein [Candidatus Paceibacterota bacterium]